MCLASVACAPAPQATLEPTPTALERAAAGATGSTADSGNPGDDVPHFKPSKDGSEPLPITSNEYGAFGAAPNAPSIGDRIADFEAPNHRGGTFSLAEARARGPVAIVFYRGFW
jgi:hypothetical protein